MRGCRGQGITYLEVLGNSAVIVIKKTLKKVMTVLAIAAVIAALLAITTAAPVYADDAPQSSKYLSCGRHSI
jgi:hypothetical protein